MEIDRLVMMMIITISGMMSIIILWACQDKVHGDFYRQYDSNQGLNWIR